MNANDELVCGTPLGDDVLEGHTNLTTWTLSGNYDEDRPILIDATNPSRFVSRRLACKLVDSLSGAFDCNSIVCLHLANDVLYPVLVLAVLASGARWSGTNPAYTVAELEHHFRLSKIKCIITDNDHVGTVRAALDASGVNAEIVVFEDLFSTGPSTKQPVYHGKNGSSTPAENLRTLRELYDLGSATNSQSLPSDRKDDIAVLMQTSGTTGLPKLAVRTHRAMMLELSAVQEDHTAKPYEVRRLFCTPIFHGFSAPEMMFNSLRLGVPTYIMRRFDSTFAQKVHYLGITEIFGAPPMLLKLIEPSDARKYLQGLKAVYFGGAPLRLELREKFLAVFDTPPRLVPVYGMIEGGWFTTLKYPDHDDTGSVGRPLPGFQLKVVASGDDHSGEYQGSTSDGLPDVQLSTNNDHSLSNGPSNISHRRHNLVGEIFVRSSQLMTSYLHNSVATAEALTPDGWLRTGDIGYFHAGKVYLVDRIKDMIKVNAWQVSPTELEHVLLQHPQILDAAVFGSGKELDEHPVVCIVRRDEDARRARGAAPIDGLTVLTEDVVKAYMRERLASYKVLKCEVVFVDSVPRNPAGKVLRKALKERHAGLKKL